jgi:hypothetical protein
MAFEVPTPAFYTVVGTPVDTAPPAQQWGQPEGPAGAACYVASGSQGQPGEMKQEAEQCYPAPTSFAPGSAF